MRQLDKAFLKDLRDQMETGTDGAVRAMLADLHPTDLAEILESLRRDDARYLYRLIPIEERAEVLIELEEDVRVDLLATMTAAEIAEEVLDELDSDDAADMIAELPESKAEEIIQLLEDGAHASDIRDLLSYDEGTAGALMAKELIRAQGDWTVAQAIREIRAQAEHVDQVFAIFVVDTEGRLTGRMSIQDLLLGPSSTRTLIRELQDPGDLIFIEAHEPADKATKLMERYDLVALPVVDAEGRLLGRITIDDAVDVIIEDAERDYQLASGLAEVVESRDSVWTLTRARLPWLLIGLMGGLGGAYVIGAFRIEDNPGMALFIPLIAAMGGNVGVQSAAIVVQGLASSTVDRSDMAARLSKELGVGLINGLICSTLILLASFVLGFGTALSITVGIALLCVIVFAALFGTFVPLTLDRYQIDPALATGPFITTANDIIGLLIYFWVGTAVATLF